MRLALVTCLVVLLLLPACIWQNAQPPAEAKHSTASLVLEDAAVPPNGQTRIGIHFKMDPDWHIYWQNPGDSGEPPKITWKLPQGVQLGPLEWPAPTRMNNPAGTDYGYQSDVVLLANLQAPPAAAAGNSLDIAGDVRWLVCHDVCIPQRAEVKAQLHIADKLQANGDEQKAIADAAARVPQPLPPGAGIVAASKSGAFELNLSAFGPALTAAEFFPLEPEQIENAAQQEFTTSTAGSRLQLKKSDHLQHDPERLKGVLVVNKQTAYQLEVPVVPSRKAQRSKS
jgi:thiol:disulfide interchange protein DsbD